MYFEVHDLNKVSSRKEFCLFEHEHTIYLDQHSATSLLQSCGFEVLHINPMPEQVCRANSLIIVARKAKSLQICSPLEPPATSSCTSQSLGLLKLNIDSFIDRIDDWINSTTGSIVNMVLVEGSVANFCAT